MAGIGIDYENEKSISYSIIRLFRLSGYNKRWVASFSKIPFFFVIFGTNWIRTNLVHEKFRRVRRAIVAQSEHGPYSILFDFLIRLLTTEGSW